MRIAFRYVSQNPSFDVCAVGYAALHPRYDRGLNWATYANLQKFFGSFLQKRTTCFAGLRFGLCRQFWCTP
jgi:hypothetical protein